MVEAAQHPAAAVKAIFGSHVTIVSQHFVGGGSINRTSVLQLNDGSRVFLKENGPRPAGMFRAEARGLTILHAAEGPYVPEPLAVYQNEAYQYLLLEYIESSPESPGFWERFGRELARMHRTAHGQSFGLDEDNYIGLTPQPNTWSPDWISFFRDFRLRYQVRLAGRKGMLDPYLQRGLEKIIERLPALLIEPAAPTLLHGDLWSGNFLVGAAGEPVLIDPAVYYGHREADIAMTELFGGFRRTFYDAYADAYPLGPGYEDRKDIYNLYHLLNHLNLFGHTYDAAVRSIVRKYGSR